MEDFPQTIHYVLIGVGAFLQLIGEVFDIVAACMFLLIKRDLAKGIYSVINKLTDDQ